MIARRMNNTKSSGFMAFWALPHWGPGRTPRPALLEARLGPLSAPDSPWHALAQEAQGLLDVRVGKTGPAKEIFRRLAQDASAPDGVRGRANGLLNRLGG